MGGGGGIREQVFGLHYGLVCNAIPSTVLGMVDILILGTFFCVRKVYQSTLSNKSVSGTFLG